MPPMSEQEWQEEHVRRRRQAENARLAQRLVLAETTNLESPDGALEAVTTVGRWASVNTLVHFAEERLREHEMTRPDEIPHEEDTCPK